MSRLGRQGERRVSSTECPVSYVTGESRSFLEEFLSERKLGGDALTVDRPARVVDAFVVLAKEVELVKEGARGE